MMHLLRSTFVAAASDNKDLLLRNYLALVDSGLDFDIKEDQTIWAYVRDFVRSYGEVPGINTLKGHFSTIKEDTIVDRLEQLAMAQSLGIGDFLVRLEDKANVRRIVQTQDILTQAGHILSQGKEVTRGKEKIKLKGPLDAIRYVMDQSHDVTAPTVGSHLSGEITGDGADFMARYERVESDPLAGIGQHSGIFQLDTAINGAKKFELWIHAAWTGGMKSSLMLNWAYNQAVFFLQDSLIFSLEMPYEQCRNILYSIHSMHPKFKNIRYQLGLQSTPDAVACVPYEFIRDGTLSKYHPNAKQFLKDYVVPDFNGERVIDGLDPQTKQPWVDPKSYGKIFIEVADPDKPDFTMADLKHRAEVIFAKTPFGMIFIDHVGLMAPRKWVPNTTDRLNEIIRDCKRLAMSFNRGRGVAVIALFQISRDGFRTAMKRKEKTGIAEYDLTCLSYCNEAERCVTISSTYVNTSQGATLIKNVKVGDQVWSSSGWKTVSQVFDNGVRRIWSVTTDRGSILEGTEKHRVRILTDGGFDWKAIKDLSTSDYVVGTFGDTPWPEKSPELPPLVIGWHEKADGDQGRPLIVPRYVTPDLAYLLGSWDGDGAVKGDGLGWTGNRKELAVRDKIMSTFEKVFDHPLGLSQSPSRPGSFDLQKCSAPLMRWFEGVAGERFLEVPDVILQSPRDVVLAYVHGLFDTDGWVNNQGIVGIKMKAACIPFLRQVQMLLVKLNIDSCLCFGEDYLEVTGKTYYNAQLRLRSRVGRERFLAEIGFTEPAKQAWLVKFVNRVHDSCKKKDGQVYPVLQTFLRAQKQIHPRRTTSVLPRSAYSLPKRIKESGRVPRGAIETLTQYAKDLNITSPEISFLRRLLDLQVMQVASVEDTGRDEPVMDLEVDGDHEYQTGPILSHNSGDIVTATFIDDDLRKMNRVQFQCLKSRDQKPFERFEARVEWACRRMLTCMDVSMKPSAPTPAGSGTANKAAIEKAGKLLD